MTLESVLIVLIVTGLVVFLIDRTLEIGIKDPFSYSKDLESKDLEIDFHELWEHQFEQETGKKFINFDLIEAPLIDQWNETLRKKYS